jgi:hypothetical protein
MKVGGLFASCEDADLGIPDECAAAVYAELAALAGAP